MMKKVHLRYIWALPLIACAIPLSSCTTDYRGNSAVTPAGAVALGVGAAVAGAAIQRERDDDDRDRDYYRNHRNPPPPPRHNNNYRNRRPDHRYERWWR